jgi:hypothetical protein
MNTNHLKTAVKSAALAIVLACGINLRAATSSPPQMLNDSVTSQNQFQTVAFSDTSEAKTLRRAYLILATGDRDYKGHRVKAMHQIEAAAKLLDMDIHGDAKGHEPQVLSDDKLREVRGMLEEVLGAAEVKGQPRISKHISEAISQINEALTIN